MLVSPNTALVFKITSTLKMHFRVSFSHEIEDIGTLNIPL
jgi:hypothetical protein